MRISKWKKKKKNQNKPTRPPENVIQKHEKRKFLWKVCCAQNILDDYIDAPVKFSTSYFLLS